MGTRVLFSVGTVVTLLVALSALKSPFLRERVTAPPAPLPALAAAPVPWSEATARPAPTSSSPVPESSRFGAFGSVDFDEIPASTLRAELATLHAGARRHALAELARLRIPLLDVASLHADREGRLFYACRPPPAPLVTAPAVAAARIASAAVPVSSPPLRHSRPGASRVIYLDFNGHTISGTAWNISGGVASYVATAFSLDGDATTFSDTEQAAIVRIWERVAEDFAPFDVDVTTEQPVVFTANTGRVLITDSVDANGVTMPEGATASGVAYLDVFGQGNYAQYSPALVYADVNYDREDYIAEVAAHEMGHNLGLSHDGTDHDEYYDGHGSGAISWGPIMGAAYDRNVSQWSQGEYFSANNPQDDLAILTSKLGAIAEDEADSNGAAPTLAVNGNSFGGRGVIRTPDDVDRFRFTVATPGSYTFNATPYRSPENTLGGNLDVGLQLLDGTGTPLASANPGATTAATASVYLGNGTYYLRISGSGAGSPLTNPPTGYTIYGSLGQYEIVSSLAAPTAPAVTQNPASVSVYAGETVLFTTAASGTPPPSYRWQRLASGAGAWSDLTNGGAYAGTDTAQLSVSASLAMHNDQFRCVATNVAGAATSAPANLAVSAPTAPSFGATPGPFNVNAGTSLTVVFSVSGSPAPALQWKRNGVVLPGRTSSYLSLTNLSSADTGSYTLTATNAAGTVTSSPVAITVHPAAIPQITTHPLSAIVNRGELFSFTLGVSSETTLSYQWYRNGVALAGATRSFLTIESPDHAHNGAYHVVVTNAGGSVASNTAQLLVQDGLPPEIVWARDTDIVQEPNTSLNVTANVTGAMPISYQWFHNGAPIPGSGPFLSRTLGPSDGGSYVLRATNAFGTAFSTELFVTIKGTESWVSAQRVGDVVHFLAAAPARILRYDLAQETWLPAIPLSSQRTPTAFWAATTGTFVAYGSDLYRIPANSQTETLVATSSLPIKQLAGVGDFVYYSEDDTISSRKLVDGSAGPSSPATYFDPFVADWPLAVSPSRRAIFGNRPGWSPNDVVSFTFNVTGELSVIGDSPYHGQYAVGGRQFISANEEFIFDRAGVRYRASDLTYAGSLGEPFHQATFLADNTPVVSRGRELALIDPTSLARRARVTLTEPARELFALGSAVFAFSPGTGAQPTVVKVPRTAFVAETPQPPPLPINQRIAIDNAFVDSSGVLHLVSSSAGGIVRWDSQTESFLGTLPLRGRPQFSHYSPADNRLVMSYADGAVSQLFPNTPVEQIFAQVSTGNIIRTTVGLDDLAVLSLSNNGAGGEYRVVVKSDGSTAHLDISGYYRILAVHADTRQLFVQTSSVPVQIETLSVSQIGVLGPLSGGSNSTALRAPLRINDDATRVLAAGSGHVLDSNLDVVAQLPGAVLDGAWHEDGLFTLHFGRTGTELRKWSPDNFSPVGMIELTGYPRYLFRLNDARLLIVTAIDGYLAIHLVTPSLAGQRSFHNNPAPPPSILGHPEASLTPADGSAKFTVSAGGAGLIYQWQMAFDGTWQNLTDGGPWSGTQTATLSIAPGMAASLHGAQFRVVLTNAQGTTISDPATLVVRQSVPGTGDFNTDGRTDLLWRNLATGEVSVWLMDGPVFAGSISLGQVGLNWQGSGTGDFNHDGHTDLLWRNAFTGQVAVWFMNGTSFAGSASLGNVALAWQSIGTGDFNHDGHTDLLWRNIGTGQVAVWFMNGATFAGSASLGYVSLDWQTAGTGDFNLDGHTDLLWRSLSTGQVAVWFMDRSTFAGSASLGYVSLNWASAGTGDFNRDGHTDLLWRSLITGEVAVWYLDRGVFAGSSSIGTISLDWQY